MKKFIKVPKDEFERLVMCAELAGSMSGSEVSLDEIMSSIEEKNLKLTKEQEEQLQKQFS